MEPTFDVNKEIEIRLFPSDRTVRVRFPTDQEWIDRTLRRKLVIKQIGRGQSETNVPGGEMVDAELLAKIRPAPNGHGTVEVDDDEANYIIDRLAEAEVTDVEQEGAFWKVTLRVPGGEVQHVLDCPSMKAAKDYRSKFARLHDLPHGKQQVLVNLAPAGELHKAVLQSATGYADPSAIPIVHRAAALRAVIDEVEMLRRSDDFSGNSKRGNGPSTLPSDS